MSLDFHAAPPKGHWINDPNGLVFCGGKWRLFAQHRQDAPDFRATGWARFSSPDLLTWQFDGCVVAPENDIWAYSGSVEQAGHGVSATYTAHSGGLEHQVTRYSVDCGASWTAASSIPSLGEPARNRRDPFVFEREGVRYLLLAEPCDWMGWSDDPPSRIAVYTDDGLGGWSRIGKIGPWSPVGVMWEVPVMARIDGHDVLLVSFVNRREDRAACSVRGWVGSFDGSTFVPEVAGEGQPIDIGPDFYAATMATGAEPPMLVAWLSNWQTARKIDWGGFAGGPISLPRTLAIEATPAGNRIMSRPARSVLDHFTVSVPATPRAGLGVTKLPVGRNASIRVSNGLAAVSVFLDFEKGALRSERTGATHLEWQGAGEFTPTADGSQLLLFVDGPVIEMFFPDLGLALSFALPGDEENFECAIDVDDERIVPDWFVLPGAI